VNYTNSKTKTRKYERPDTVPVNSLEFDPYKTLSKINNHKEVRGPNFNLMTSRPQGKNALPCFVQVINKIFLFFLENLWETRNGYNYR